MIILIMLIGGSGQQGVILEWEGLGVSLQLGTLGFAISLGIMAERLVEYVLVAGSEKTDLKVPAFNGMHDKELPFPTRSFIFRLCRYKHCRRSTLCPSEVSRER